MQASGRWGYVGIALLVVAIAAACTSNTEDASETSTTTIARSTTSQPPPTTSTTTKPLPTHPYGGQVIIGDEKEPPTLNVFLPGGDSAIAARIGQGYLAGVQEIDGNSLELIPELVTELPTVGNGGVVVNLDGTMTVKYTIRDEAMWSDGVSITGEDFQFTLDMILDPTLPISPTIYETVVRSAYSDKTFEYTLARPTAQYELLFNTILPKHAVDGTDFVADWNDVMWPSAGPFVLTEWSKGESLTLERNDAYWKVDPETGQDLPYLDEVVFSFVPSTEDLVEGFKARDLDVIQPPPSPETIQQLQTLEPEGARVEVISGPVWEHLGFQFGQERFDRNPDSCNESLNMRTAIAYAIDRSKLTDELFDGQVEPMQSYIEVYSPTLSHGNWAQYEPDVDKAAAAYAAAVAETGKECKVVFTTTSKSDARATTADLFASMFEAAGIPYENDLEDTQLFLGNTVSFGTFDLAEWTWIGSPGLSGLVASFDLFDPQAPPPGGSNYYRWGSEGSDGVDEASRRFAVLRDEVNATVDDAELRSLIREGEAILADNLVIIPLYARPVVAAVWADEISGFKHNPTQATDTWNIEYWYRTDG